MTLQRSGLGVSTGRTMTSFRSPGAMDSESRLRPSWIDRPYCDGSLERDSCGVNQYLEFMRWRHEFGGWRSFADPNRGWDKGAKKCLTQTRHDIDEKTESTKSSHISLPNLRLGSLFTIEGDLSRNQLVECVLKSRSLEWRGRPSHAIVDRWGCCRGQQVKHRIDRLRGSSYY